MKWALPAFLSGIFLYVHASCQTPDANALIAAAIELTGHKVIYDASYYRIDYPGGDVPPDRGVCSDVLIRAYRKISIDLQKEVHEDMIQNFDKYPTLWGLTKTDRNIDHRRVPNLMTFFSRKGLSLPVTSDSEDYLPGDIVTWLLDNGQMHIGIVINLRNTAETRNLIVHNIGNGQEISDCLFQFRIAGHYRYLPPTHQR